MFDEAWTDFADILLGQEAMLARVRFGAPDPMAGLHVDPATVDQIVPNPGGRGRRSARRGRNAAISGQGRRTTVPPAWDSTTQPWSCSAARIWSARP